MVTRDNSFALQRGSIWMTTCVSVWQGSIRMIVSSIHAGYFATVMYACANTLQTSEVLKLWMSLEPGANASHPWTTACHWRLRQTSRQPCPVMHSKSGKHKDSDKYRAQNRAQHQALHKQLGPAFSYFTYLGSDTWYLMSPISAIWCIALILVVLQHQVACLEGLLWVTLEMHDMSLPRWQWLWYPTMRCRRGSAVASGLTTRPSMFLTSFARTSSSSSCVPDSNALCYNADRPLYVIGAKHTSVAQLKACQTCNVWTKGLHKAVNGANICYASVCFGSQLL